MTRDVLKVTIERGIDVQDVFEVPAYQSQTVLDVELLSNLVFGGCWSCCDLAGFSGFNSVFECDASDDFGEVVKAA